MVGLDFLQLFIKKINKMLPLLNFCIKVFARINTFIDFSSAQFSSKDFCIVCSLLKQFLRHETKNYCFWVQKLHVHQNPVCIVALLQKKIVADFLKGQINGLSQHQHMHITNGNCLLLLLPILLLILLSWSPQKIL